MPPEKSVRVASSIVNPEMFTFDVAEARCDIYKIREEPTHNTNVLLLPIHANEVLYCTIHPVSAFGFLLLLLRSRPVDV